MNPSPEEDKRRRAPSAGLLQKIKGSIRSFSKTKSSQIEPRKDDRDLSKSSNLAVSLGSLDAHVRSASESVLPRGGSSNASISPGGSHKVVNISPASAGSKDAISKKDARSISVGCSVDTVHSELAGGLSAKTDPPKQHSHAEHIAVALATAQPLGAIASNPADEPFKHLSQSPEISFAAQEGARLSLPDTPSQSSKFRQRSATISSTHSRSSTSTGGDVRQSTTAARSITEKSAKLSHSPSNASSIKTGTRPRSPFQTADAASAAAPMGSGQPAAPTASSELRPKSPFALNILTDKRASSSSRNNDTRPTSPFAHGSPNAGTLHTIQIMPNPLPVLSKERPARNDPDSLNTERRSTSSQQNGSLAVTRHKDQITLQIGSTSAHDESEDDLAPMATGGIGSLSSSKRFKSQPVGINAALMGSSESIIPKSGKSSKSMGALNEIDGGSKLIPCFTSSERELFRMSQDWRDREFPDSKYSMWRIAMIYTLSDQQNFPLIMPPELVYLLSEDILPYGT
ncbi:uncharacterized protein BJ171DRAFT_496631 [Polychytrium aggregatum]|uniref:uncharacterized protein n=1 Tax=Polychytrium aggregatum TaxID=110093 RepID=UPI0022FE1935|nr:uncharacterized protein BJ171DRAFT_496631 [Polychytrium aggregatum]KAI9206707.1 hypothetical protein BJ171DRAFT_496631 [Polychytrium aggregatum]